MLSRTLPVLVAAFAGLGAGSQGASAQTPEDAPIIAVMDFTGFLLGEGGNSAPLGKAVSAMLVTELTGRPGLRVIERQNLQALIQEQKLTLSGMVDQNYAVQVGRILGAQYMLFGAASAAGGTLRIDVRAVDVETSEIITVDKLSGKTEEILDVVVRVADNFGDKLDLEPRSERPEPIPIPPLATIEFSRAVDFEDKGDFERAAQHYQRALEIHPEHSDAKRALERLARRDTDG